MISSAWSYIVDLDSLLYDNTIYRTNEQLSWGSKYCIDFAIEVECVRKHTVTLCGSVYRFFDIDLLAAPRCAGNKCRFECPIGTQPSHPQG